MSPVSQSSDKAAHYYWQQQLKVLPTDLARLPRGEDLPGGGRPLLPLGLDPIPMAEREGDEARRGARGVVSEPRLEVKSCWWGSRWHSVQYIWPGKTWLGGLGLNFLGGGWGEGWSVQWGTSKLVAASCHCWRLPLVNVSSDLLTRIIVKSVSLENLQ